MSLRKQLLDNDPELASVLNAIPDNATDEQIYFYIWAQGEEMYDRVPIPNKLDTQCVEILRKWIISDNEYDFKSLLTLRPLAYDSGHFQDLFKLGTNRKQIFTNDNIEMIETLFGKKVPNILYYFLQTVRNYPIYQQYALAVIFFLHIDHAYNNDQLFLKFKWFDH